MLIIITLLALSIPSVLSHGANSVFPTPTASVTLPTASIIPAGATFDGELKRYDRGPGACQGQAELDETAAVFILEQGATLKNVVVGPDQAEGIHCRGACRLENIWWEHVCEDAATFKQEGADDVSYVIGGGALHADDKTFQHNGAGTVQIVNFFAQDVGKLYRSCGNCSKMFQRHVVVNGSWVIDGDQEATGININYGDTSIIRNSCLIPGIQASEICKKYNGCVKPCEAQSVSKGPDGVYCQYTLPDDVNQCNGWVPVSTSKTSSTKTSSTKTSSIKTSSTRSSSTRTSSSRSSSTRSSSTRTSSTRSSSSSRSTTTTS